jgi:dynein heavy chain, axonemal
MLSSLSASEGDILDDQDLVDTLSHTKAASEEISRKMVESERTQVEVATARNVFLPVAQRACSLFFCVADLASVDPMYQFSLAWFTTMFVNCVKSSELVFDAPTRIHTLNTLFTSVVFTSVCRSLYGRHKLMFAVMIASRLMQNEQRLNEVEWRYVFVIAIDLLVCVPTLCVMDGG